MFCLEVLGVCCFSIQPEGTNWLIFPLSGWWRANLQNYLLHSLAGAMTCRCMVLHGLPLPFYSDKNAHAHRKKQNAYAKYLFSFIFPIRELHCKDQLQLSGQPLFLGLFFFHFCISQNPNMWRLFFLGVIRKFHHTNLVSQRYSAKHTVIISGLTWNAECPGRSGWGRCDRWHRCWSHSPGTPGRPGRRLSLETVSPAHRYLDQTDELMSTAALPPLPD